ncbi:hypothetical protein C8R47DRAFT_244481 [Mycena vitilis]|nr:hypothetical protein C8R47DRAFT_244481 [Mycena vitilis]
MFVIYTPNGSPDLEDSSSFTHQELRAFEDALPPSGGTILSTHYPKDALSWVETHYNDGLLACMRLRKLGGPMATMLFPETQALAVFGSIKRKWVLRAAKTLADISGFVVIIQPLSNNPVLQWNEPATGSEWFEPSDNEAETDAMTPPTAENDLDEYAGWMSPVHRSDIHLQLCPSANLAHDVTIVTETQFKVQNMYEDKHRHGFRPQVISRTHMKVASPRVLPNRSHGSIGFLSREQWTLGKEWYNCGFDKELYRELAGTKRYHRIPCLPLHFHSRETRESLEDDDDAV